MHYQIEIWEYYHEESQVFGNLEGLVVVDGLMDGLTQNLTKTLI